MADPIVVEKVRVDSDLTDDSFRHVVGQLGVEPADCGLYYSNGSAAEAHLIARLYKVQIHFIPYQAIGEKWDWWAVRAGQSWIWSPGV